MINLVTVIVFAILQSTTEDTLFMLKPVLPWVYSGDLAGARTLLSTIAGSMISVTGVVFSITIVALTLASSQFGPRLLRNFMHSKVTQLVLGSLSATFVFCILVQTSISTRTVDFTALNLSVTTAIAMTMVSLFLLVYFIHHVATSIQADRLIAVTFRELDDNIDRLFPHENYDESDSNPAQHETLIEDNADPVFSTQGGNLQAIDHKRVIQLAHDEDLIIKFCYVPGDYLIKGSKLALIWTDSSPCDELTQKINQALMVGAQRTPEQDVSFSITQLVEIAVRALSPGINDPFTAISCIKSLAAALCKLGTKSSPSGYEYDNSNQLRLIVETPTYAELLDLCFNHILQYGRQNAIVLVELIRALVEVSKVTVHQSQLQALNAMADRIMLAAKGSDFTSYDFDRISGCYQVFLQQARQHD
jgi:uncharacterized membrane protein